MRTHYGPWQSCWISNQHQKHKSGRGPSSEHFWQVWLISVQRFQRRRFKYEKLTDGRTDERRTLTHDKSSHGLWPGELKRRKEPLNSSLPSNCNISCVSGCVSPVGSAFCINCNTLSIFSCKINTFL